MLRRSASPALRSQRFAMKCPVSAAHRGMPWIAASSCWDRRAPSRAACCCRASVLRRRRRRPAGRHLASSALDALPGKRPLIKRSYRPPNFETPVELFREAYTPNDAFYVRWHSGVPEVALADWRLRVAGPPRRSRASTRYDELLRRLQAARGRGRQPVLRQPPRPVRAARAGRAVGLRCDGQRGVGRGAAQGRAGGCRHSRRARSRSWRRRRRAAAHRARLREEPADLEGARPGHAARLRDERRAAARWNGFPARIVVPGWTATYWIKAVADLTVTDKPFDGFWMKTAYRVPKGMFGASGFESQETEQNSPITAIKVNSLIVGAGAGREAGGRPARRGDGHRLGRGLRHPPGRGVDRRRRELARGAARRRLGAVLVASVAFRLRAEAAGPVDLLARALAATASRSRRADANPAGYHHNVVQRADSHVARLRLPRWRAALLAAAPPRRRRVEPRGSRPARRGAGAGRLRGLPQPRLHRDELAGAGPAAGKRPSPRWSR